MARASSGTVPMKCRGGFLSVVLITQRSPAAGGTPPRLSAIFLVTGSVRWGSMCCSQSSACGGFACCCRTVLE
jgi:hypothetical protein